MKTLELRSDTFTRPTPGMLQAMMAAPVGDDVFGEDPTVNQLEERLAAYFGKEAAMFCASGTMANQIGIQVHIRQGDEVICEREAHVYIYEGGGIAAFGGASIRPIAGQRGQLTATEILANISDPHNVHLPISRLVCLENTANRGGGSCYSIENIREIRQVCDQHQLALHLDGARLFNAMVAGNHTPEALAAPFDTLSVCLSKGLGAPVGSVLLGSRDHIRLARRIRKRMGGGWRQAGILAAAGLYALDNHIERLAEDHQRARALATIMRAVAGVKAVEEPETNIVLLELEASLTPATFCASLAAKQILCLPFGPQKVRMITHLDFTEQDLNDLQERLR